RMWLGSFMRAILSCPVGRCPARQPDAQRRPADEDDKHVVAPAPSAVPDREVHVLTRLGRELSRLPDERVVDAERVAARQDLDRQLLAEEHLAEARTVERADDLPRLLVTLRRAMDRQQRRRENREAVLV